MSMILAIDLGSSQLKLLVMDGDGAVNCVIARPCQTQTPQRGWLMQEPGDWLLALKEGLEELAERISPDKIDVISFSGHMSGVVAMDKAGEVLYPCIMLSDTRSEEECRQIADCAGEDIRKLTGNPVINAFSLPKLLWLKKNIPQVYRDMEVWLSPKDYLRYALTGRVGTEYTDAGNSLCVKPGTAIWSRELIAACGLDREKFPPIFGPMEHGGTISRAAAGFLGLKEGTPVVFGAADMACGAIGNGLFHSGDATLTLGTCATFLAMGNNAAAWPDAYGKLTFHPHVLPGRFYGLGSHFNGGLAVNWLSRILSEDERIDYEMIRRLSEEAELVPAGCGGVMTLPFLAGSGSPYYDSDDRQTVLGLNTSTTRAVVFKSQLEGITFNLRQSLELFEQLMGNPMNRIVLGGGGVKIGIWPQMIADVFGTPVSVAENADASAQGAALLGGCGVGIFTNLEETALASMKIREARYPQNTISEEYKTCYKKYLRAYEIIGQLR